MAAKRLQVPHGGVSLIELLVVIGIVAILVALLLPAIGQSREASRAAACRAKLAQLGRAVIKYHDAHHRLPPGQFLGAYGKGPNSHAWSWLARLLPQMELGALAEEAHVPRSTLNATSVPAKRIDSFLCPSDSYSHRGPIVDAGDLIGFVAGQANYQAVLGANWGADASLGLDDIQTDWRNPGTNGSWDGMNHPDGIMFRSDSTAQRSFALVTDGTSHTFMLGENLPEFNRWCSWAYSNNAYATCAIPPNVVPIEGHDYGVYNWPNVLGFRSRHPGGTNFAYADGSVHFVADDVELALYRAMATIAGREQAQLP